MPPPPRNQLILLTFNTPYEAQSLFDPVWAVGIFGVNETETKLAKVGYAMTVQEVTSYK